MDKIRLNDITADHGRQAKDKEDQYGPDQVGPGRRVTMHFELALPEGDIIDSNFDGSPVTFEVGDGNLPPGFEQQLNGLRAGAEHTVLVSADAAFGRRNPGNLQTLPRYRFPADLAMEEGLVLNFTDSAGNEQAGVIAKCDSGNVTVDFNHPLAGRDIRFRVKILSVGT